MLNGRLLVCAVLVPGGFECDVAGGGFLGLVGLEVLRPGGVVPFRIAWSTSGGTSDSISWNAAIMTAKDPTGRRFGGSGATVGDFALA